jgi:hypothetical protein
MWPFMFLVYLVLLLMVTPIHAQDPVVPKEQKIFAEKEQALRAQEMRLREAMEEIKALEGATRVTETSSTLQQAQLTQRDEEWSRKQQMMRHDPAISDEAERQAYARALQASQESQRALAELRQKLAVAQSNKGTIEARLNSIRDEWKAAKADWRRFQATQLRQQFERVQKVEVHGEVGCAGDSSIRECQRHALERALGLAAEQGSVVSVTTLSEVKNLQLTRDEIRTQVKALLLSHEILDEGVVGRGSGYYYKVRAQVRSQISDKLVEQLIGADPSLGLSRPLSPPPPPPPQPVPPAPEPSPASPEAVVASSSALSDDIPQAPYQPSTPAASGSISAPPSPAQSVAALPPLPPVQPPRYQLRIRVEPSGSRVRIMNIAPPYYPGIELEPGQYDILVDRQGYVDARRLVTIANTDVVVDITLDKIPIPPPQARVDPPKQPEPPSPPRLLEPSSPQPALPPPRQVRLEPQPTRRYKLALLPTNVTMSSAGYHDAEGRAADLLEQAIAKTDLFELAFSYRTTSNPSSAKNLKNLWGFTGKPKYKSIYQIANDLGVDAVIMYSFELTTGPDDMDIFLINVRADKTYNRSVRTEGAFSDGAGYSKELETTLQIFEDYRKDLQ